MFFEVSDNNREILPKGELNFPLPGTSFLVSLERKDGNRYRELLPVKRQSFSKMHNLETKFGRVTLDKIWDLATQF